MSIRVLSNIFEGTIAPVAFVGCVDSVVANNTIIDPERWLLRILQETISTEDYDFFPSSNNDFKNNLLYYHRGQLSTYVNIGPDTAPETYTFSNNLWYAHDTPSASTPSLPVVETDGIYGIAPLLADPAGRNYQIAPDSPAFHAGLSPPLIFGRFCRYLLPRFTQYRRLWGASSLHGWFQRWRWCGRWRSSGLCVRL